MRMSVIALMILTAALLVLAGRTASTAGALSQAHAYLPFVARQLRPTATPTITPTPIPPFSGVAQIQYTDNAVDGWGWPAGSSVIIDVTSSEGTHKDTVALEANSNGNLPWTEFNTHLAEGDWITVTLDSMHAGFPILLAQATGDPATDTIVGRARPFARVAALVGHGEGWFWLETDADGRGDFLLDFSSQVDWDYDDYVRVGQYLNANGLVNVTGRSEHFHIIPPPTATPTLTATPTVIPTATATPSHDAPPFIRIDAPSDAYVGEEIVLDASGTWDIDADPFELTWTQYHNPDRYQGLEYVTGNDVLLESLDGSQSVIYPGSLSGVAQVRVAPEWPGNYRFELLATDSYGESRQHVDVLVQARQPQFQVRGVMIDVWSDAAWDVAESFFDTLLEHGVNLVSIQPSLYMEERDSSAVHIVPAGYDPSVGVYNMSDGQLDALIALSHERGMTAMIKPFIWGLHYSFSGIHISPSHPQMWIESYGSILAHYARLALHHDDHDVWLCIGNDLRALHAYEEGWSTAIETVRRINPSLTLTYADPSWNWTGDPATADLPAFLPYLDVLGVQFYTFGDEGGHPSVAQLAHRIDESVRIAEAISTAYDKPVLLTEFGVLNYDGATANTGIWPDVQQPHLDYQEQVDYYEAAFRQFSGQSWLLGPIIWSLQVSERPFYFHEFRPLEVTNDFRGLPVETVVDLYYLGRVSN